jgi:hypothetical protein
MPKGEKFIPGGTNREALAGQQKTLVNILVDKGFLLYFLNGS